MKSSTSSKGKRTGTTFQHKIGGCCVALVALVGITITVAFLMYCGYTLGKVDGQQDTSIGASASIIPQQQQPKASITTLTEYRHDDSITIQVLTNTSVISTPHGHIIITVND